MKVARIVPALPALALAAALGTPGFAQSEAQSTLDMDALPEAEVQRVQEHCDMLADEEGNSAGAETEGQSTRSDKTATAGSAHEGGDASGSDGAADVAPESDASGESEGEKTPSPAGSVNETAMVDLGTITLDACIEAGFTEDQ